MYGVPTMYHRGTGAPGVRAIRSDQPAHRRDGRRAVPDRVMKRVAERMHCPGMTIAYGQTETSPVITMSSVGRPAGTARHHGRQARCPTRRCRSWIRTAATRLPMGKQGELCTRGYLVMKGYDGDPEATGEAVDHARAGCTPATWPCMRPDDYFSFKGRAKDTIIRGGENIYPREVEEFLHTHPKIADVYGRACRTPSWGRPCWPGFNSRPAQPATEEEIRDFCRGKIAYFKIPQFIRFVDGFPIAICIRSRTAQISRAIFSGVFLSGMLILPFHPPPPGQFPGQRISARQSQQIRQHINRRVRNVSGSWTEPSSYTNLNTRRHALNLLRYRPT